MADCPRCRQLLVENQVDEFTVRLCVPCKGILLSHSALVKILERSWRAVTPEAAEKLEFHAPEDWQNEPTLHCPDCGRTMDKYGYMGLGAIEMDRCEQCTSVWLDADELQNMVLALAKDNYRSAARKSIMADTFDPMVGNMAVSAPADYVWLFDQRIKDKRDIRNQVSAEVLLSLLSP